MSHESVPDEGDVETTKEECCKRVGADGGRLELESFGIELEIPPGAIDSKEPQEISLRVLTDTPNLGDTKEEMSVCFGVQCLAPDDLVLRSPVTYTIPHCAVATRYSSLQAVLYSGEGEYSPHAVIKERKVLSSSEIPSCKIMKDVLKLKMDHFSWAKIKIRINNIFFQGKRICFVPFKEKNLSLAKTPLILHANFYDDVKGQKEPG
ncbi:netrin receptor unc-5-like [Lytechinus variegatus]|uniref:netrin receptor unc-5-like n=1 Tax=Lytechinus variegatus TaxID=7654 RepID=UPI001BB0EE08|nr:netrin receptor unc-5-like [Lytechinus variegatus]